MEEYSTLKENQGKDKKERKDVGHYARGDGKNEQVSRASFFEGVVASIQLRIFHSYSLEEAAPKASINTSNRSMTMR